MGMLKNDEDLDFQDFRPRPRQQFPGEFLPVERALCFLQLMCIPFSVATLCENRPSILMCENRYI
jgi:hypothetical protein